MVTKGLIPPGVGKARMLMLDLSKILGVPILNLPGNGIDEEWDMLADAIRERAQELADKAKGKR